MSESKKGIIAGAIVLLLVAGGVAYYSHLRGQIDSIAMDNDRSREESYERTRREVMGLPTLATCTVCDGKVSSDAKSCPHCGDPR